MSAAAGTAHDCKRPNVLNMDHVVGYYPELQPMVSRMCLTCGTHWFGNADAAVFEMPRKVWDNWIETAFTAQPSNPRTSEAPRNCGTCQYFDSGKCHAGEFEAYENFPLPVGVTDVCECHEFACAGGQP